MPTSTETVQLLFDERELLIVQLSNIERLEAMVLRRLQRQSEYADQRMHFMHFVADLVPLAQLFRSVAKSYSKLPQKLKNLQNSRNTIAKISQSGGRVSKSEAGRLGGFTSAFNKTRKLAAGNAGKLIAEDLGQDGIEQGFELPGKMQSGDSVWRSTTSFVRTKLRGIIDPEADSGYHELPITQGISKSFMAEYMHSREAVEKALDDPSTVNILASFGEFFHWYDVLTDLGRLVDLGYGHDQSVRTEVRLKFIKDCAAQKNAIRERIRAIERVVGN